MEGGREAEGGGPRNDYCQPYNSSRVQDICTLDISMNTFLHLTLFILGHFHRFDPEAVLS